MMFRRIYYYATARRDVIEAFNQDALDVARIEATAEKFAEQFGAVPLYTSGFDSHFVGIAFTREKPCANPGVWSKDKETDPRRVPLNPTRAGERFRAEATKLYKQFWDTWPTEIAKPRTSALMTLLGIDVMAAKPDLFVYHELDAVAYIATSVPLELEECFASKYVEAEKLATSPFKPAGQAAAIQQLLQETANGNNQ